MEMQWDNMTFFVISDLHGSEKDLDLVIKRAREQNATEILVAGDLCIPNLNFYIKIKNTPFTWHIVRGNSDYLWDIIEYNKVPFPISLNLTYDDKTIFMYHGDKYLGSNYSDIVITGHTHVPNLYTENGVIYLNPGSCAQPRIKEGKTYALIKDQKISIYSLSSNKVLTSLDIS